MEGVEAEAVVDALVQDAPQFPVPFQNENVPQTRLVGGHGCRQPCGTAADDDQIGVFHGCTSLSRPVSRTDEPPDLVTSVREMPSSRARMAATLGEQKPP